tara:strand:+ start:6490 stop:6924 length:435 start_codon:yes stop_codon:yes gene_type:complete
LTTQYNWNELKLASEYQLEGIIILAYCLSKGYNEIIANDSNHLFNKLRINKIPLCIVRKKLVRRVNHKLRNYYQCKEPQSYFNNADFLTFNCSTSEKVEYLYILSNRHLNDKNPYIPKEYIDTKHWKNKLTRIEKDSILFIPEL